MFAATVPVMVIGPLCAYQNYSYITCHLCIVNYIIILQHMAYATK